MMPDSESKKPTFWASPIFWGSVASLVIVGGMIALAFADVCVGEAGADCQSKWRYLLSARPNEIGDTLAGFAGALAFVWIIVTVWLQGKELAAQREELVLTRAEMEEQRKATQDMARSMAAQAKIFQDEQRQREEETAKDELDRLLEGLSFALDNESRGSDLTRGYLQEPDTHGNVECLHFFRPKREEAIDQYILSNARCVSDFWIAHDGRFSSGGEQFTGWIGYYQKIEELLQKIGELSPRLSRSQNQRLENMDIQSLQSDIQDLVHNGPWGDECHMPRLGEE